VPLFDRFLQLRRALVANDGGAGDPDRGSIQSNGGVGLDVGAHSSAR